LDASGDGKTADAAIDAPPVACTQTTCTNNVLEVCGSNGVVTSTEQCPLGCYTDNMRCNGILPSNGLTANVDQAATQGDVALPDGTTINTDTGTVNGPTGAIAVASATVSQNGGPTLRVLIGKTWTIGDVRVSGSMPLAIVSAGDITINGVLDLSADASSGGPGAQACGGGAAGGAPASGFFSNVPAGNSGGYPQYLWNIGGGGGGGFGTGGGNGGNAGTGSTGGAGGGPNGTAPLVPLRGGCSGYAATGSYLGAGGGAVQLVSNKTIHLVDGGTKKGMIHVGGGAAHAGDLGKASLNDTTAVYGPGGGGSGGGILIEAGKVILDANTALLAAGAGAGGYGACTNPPNGMDSPASAATATGGACPAGTTPTASGGDGATTANGGGGANSTTGSAGGGGGGLGRIRINTADAQYSSQSTSLVRGAVTTGMAPTR